MRNAQEIGQQVQEQTLDTARKAQDAVVEAITAWTETANPPISDNFAKQFPTFAEVIDSNFDFAQRILNSQRDFAHVTLLAAALASGADSTKPLRAIARLDRVVLLLTLATIYLGLAISRT